LYNKTYHPVEFINNAWHFLDWDDGKYLGYWVTPKHKIESGNYQLGGLGSVARAATPQGMGPSFVQIRERAELGSTQLKEPSQPQEHYLPITLPLAQGLAPIGINPIWVRSTVTAPASETIFMTQGAAQLITNAVKINGQLKGKVLDTFDGDRTKTKTFMNSFDLFWMTNNENSAMKIPYKQCTYFLGLLSGAKVDNWVHDQTKILLEKVIHCSDPIKKTDENLWEDLKGAFTSTFANMSKIEDAKIALSKVKMEGDWIDEYIAKFEGLLCKADIPRTEVTVMTMFTNGLCKGIHAAIL